MIDTSGSPEFYIQSDKCRSPHFFHALRLDTDAFIMIRDRARTRIKCVQLALRVARCRILVAAPMIQHLRDMADLSFAFSVQRKMKS